VLIMLGRGAKRARSPRTPDAAVRRMSRC
jgi:hypothetical protein